MLTCSVQEYYTVGSLTSFSVPAISAPSFFDCPLSKPAAKGAPVQACSQAGLCASIDTHSVSKPHPQALLTGV